MGPFSIVNIAKVDSYWPVNVELIKTLKQIKVMKTKYK